MCANACDNEVNDDILNSIHISNINADNVMMMMIVYDMISNDNVFCIILTILTISWKRYY